MTPKIYTKTGDRGETGILGRERLSKADLRLCAYGTVDELNAIIGLAIATSPPELSQLCDFLTATQHHLFVIGSHLACSDEKMRLRLPEFDAGAAGTIEREIDDLNQSLKELREFILPGGTQAASTLHFCRTVCRRAEREVVRFFDREIEKAPALETRRDEIITYLNRLGDYLFVAARFANHTFNVEERIWQK